MRQLVRDHGLHPGVVDLGRLDLGEERPDLGQGDAAHVLSGARPQRAVEVVRVRVDVEVDRIALGDPQARLGLLDAEAGDLERRAPERVIAVVPVDPDRGAGRGLAVHGAPREPVVEIGQRDVRPHRHVPVVGGDPEARHQVRVRVEVVVDQVEVRPKRAAREIPRALHLLDARPDLALDLEEQLDAADGRRRERDRLFEPDLTAERDAAAPFAELHAGVREDRGRQRQEGQQRDDGGDGSGGGPAHHWLHARPARRRMPRPFWSAPRRSGRASAQPVP